MQLNAQWSLLLMSDTNRSAIRAVKETSYRVFPANPVYQEVRITSAGMTYSPTTEVSNELDSTRQVRDLILTGFDAAGDVATEYSIGNIDVFMEGAMCNPWRRSAEIYNGISWEYGTTATRITGAVLASTTTTLTVTAATTLSGTAANAATTAFVVNGLIRNSGYSVAANNGVFLTTASTATTVAFTGGASETPPATARTKLVGVQGASGDIAATVTSGNALTSTTLDFTTLPLLVGQWVKISNEAGAFSFATAGNNTYARVSAIAAQRLSFDVVVGTWAADVGTGKTIRLYFGDSIRNGVALYSYRVEQQLELDAGTRYAYFRGMEVNSMAFNGDTRAIIQVTLNLMGSDSTGYSPTRDAGAATGASANGTVLDSSNAVPFLLEGGSTVTAPNYVSSFSFSLENNLRAKTAVGSPGAISIGQGRASFTGNLNTYFGDETVLNKLITNTASSVAFSFRDSADSSVEIWDIPRLKYSSGAPEITGIDADIFSNLAFQGLRDAVGGRDYTVLLSRFDYAA